MKITEIPPVEPTYHIELSQAEVNALYVTLQPESDGEYEEIARMIEQELLSHTAF